MMNCNRNRQMVKRRIYSFQMDGESRAEAICRDSIGDSVPL